MANRAEVERFLKALDPKQDKFTFQTFDDDSKRKSKQLAHVLHGTLAKHWSQLCALNKAGAGIYLTVNETDLKGRKAENITRIRAVFADLDGAPLAPALKKPEPQIVVESSPKRWHTYWLVKDMELDAQIFRAAQKQIIKRLRSDPAIIDLPRVLRLPGFTHQKGKPFDVRIIKLNNIKPYKAGLFLAKNTKSKNQRSEEEFTTHEAVDISIVKIALEIIPSDNYQIWFEIGCALAFEFKLTGFELFDRWSRKSDKYDKERCLAKWKECCKVKGFSAGTIFHYANEIDPHWRDAGEIPGHATFEDFVSYLPQHNYIYLPTGQSWPAGSVNASLLPQVVNAKKYKPAAWLDKFRKVEGMTWSPGDPEIIHNKVAREEGGWVRKPGAAVLNLYYPPQLQLEGAQSAKPWLNLLHTIFPNDAEHILNFLAHRVQFPGEKINHALVLGGEQGIGKDTLLEPIKHAVGPWNFTEISPRDVGHRFNSYIKSVVCRISEAHDLGEMSRFEFYEILKTLTATPPDTLICEEKFIKRYAIANVTSIIMTTNYKTGGIYLPANDRRTYVAWSDITSTHFPTAYWETFWEWYRNSGIRDVAAFLHARDLSRFNAKAAPLQTSAFLDIVETSLPPEDAEFSEAIGNLKNPKALCLSMILQATHSHSFAEWLQDRRNARIIPHRLESCGYSGVRNPEHNRNRWRFRRTENNTNRQFDIAIYGRKELPEKARIEAAKLLLLQLQALNVEILHT